MITSVIRKIITVNNMIILFTALLLTFLFNNNDSKAAVLEPDQQKMLNITLLGDSYSAGNGAGEYYGKSGSYLSRNNWAHHYTDWLNSQGVKTTLTSYAHGGDKTTDVIRDQIRLVANNTDLVMLTIGGNDVNFADIVRSCYAILLNNGKDCRNFVNQANSKLDYAMQDTKSIFKSLENKISTNAKIVLVGYPMLSIDTDYTFEWCDYPLAFKCTMPGSYEASAEIRALGLKANQKQAELVTRWNAEHDLKAIYVSGVSDAFAGHEPDPSRHDRNPKRWINEFLETEGKVNLSGEVEWRFSSDLNEWYHPNITGHEQIAKVIEAEVGVPSSAHFITPDVVISMWSS